MTPSAVLILHQLSVGYSQRHVLQNINATLHAGELVCLLGPNGAGKTTLLRTLAGLQKPQAGRVDIGSDNLHQLAPSALAQRLAIVLTERIDVDHLQVYDLVALGRQPHTGWMGTLSASDHTTVQYALAATHIEALAQRQVAQLSDGERQRVMIARALAQEPQILLLDEPTAFLDLPRRVEIMLLLRQLARDSGRAFLLSTHDLDLALHVADRIWLLSSTGDFASDAPEALALDGTITRTFQNEGVAFDVASGGFNLCLPQHDTARVRGTGPAALWTRRALERLGYRLVLDERVTSATIDVIVVNANEWQLRTAQQQSTLHSLRELLAALRGH